MQGGDTPSIKEAGIPNITGSSGVQPYVNPSGFFGALYFTNAQTQVGAGEGTAWNTRGYVSLDASRSNPTYGNADTVQPPAIALIPQIKY